jgi:CBS domain-containing protein
MKASDVMSRDVQVVTCETTLRQAAELMRTRDIGSLPVSRDGALVGMVTDRDIVVRAIAEGFDIQSPVSRVMSENLKTCHVDQSVDAVAAQMSELGVRRLPVVDDASQIVGFISLSNIAAANKPAATDKLLDGTANPHC